MTNRCVLMYMCIGMFRPTMLFTEEAEALISTGGTGRPGVLRRFVDLYVRKRYLQDLKDNIRSSLMVLHSIIAIICELPDSLLFLIHLILSTLIIAPQQALSDADTLGEHEISGKAPRLMLHVRTT